MTSVQFTVSEISSSMSTLSIVASGQEFVLVCGATLREICWEGGVMFIGANPSDSSGQIGAKKGRISR